MVPIKDFIPKSRLFIDKVGFQFPSWYLRDESYRDYRVGDLTILKWGNTSRVLVHDERIRDAPFPALSVFAGLVELARAGVFNDLVCTFVLDLWHRAQWGDFSFMTAFTVVEHFFRLDELELSQDIPQLARFGEFDTSETFTQKAGTSFYSKRDYKKERRGPSSKRPGEPKGVQKSFFAVYRKDRQLGLDDPIYRLEFRFSGKYRRHIGAHLLYLDPSSTLVALAPAIHQIVTDLGVTDNVAINPIALLVPDSPLAKLFDTIGWPS